MQAYSSRTSELFRFAGATGLALLFASTTVGLLVPALPACAAADPAVSCAASKQKAAAKKLSSKMKCHEKAMKKGVGVDPECLVKAEGKFVAAFDKAEEKGGCITTNDAVALEATIDDTVASLYSQLPRGACPVECADALIAVTQHGDTHYPNQNNCHFDLARQAGSVLWDVSTFNIISPDHNDEIHVRNGFCSVVDQNVPVLNIPLTNAEQDACAPLAAEAALDLYGGWLCDVLP